MGLFNRLVPRRGDFIVILGMAAVVVLSLLVLLTSRAASRTALRPPATANVYAFVWAEISTGVVENLLLIEFSTYVDGITVLMLAVVSIVTLMVMIYSVGYMKARRATGWYLALLSASARRCSCSSCPATCCCSTSRGRRWASPRTC